MTIETTSGDTHRRVDRPTVVHRGERRAPRRWRTALLAGAAALMSIGGLTAAGAQPAAADSYGPGCWNLPRHYVFTANGVNIRTGPGTSYTIVGQMHNRNFLCGPGIEYRTGDGSRGCSTGWWAKVGYNGVYRYACTTYLVWYS